MTDKSVVPEGMVAWAGGDGPPADWDESGPVMLSGGFTFRQVDQHDPIYWGWDHDDIDSDVIAYTPSNPLSLETSDLDPITPEENALATKAIVAMGWTRQAYDSAVRMVRVVMAEIRGRVERYRHVKRGTVYEVIGRAELQMSYDLLVDGSEMVVYRGEDGKLWVRQEDEFMDGRFEPVAHSIQSGGEGGAS